MGGRHGSAHYHTATSQMASITVECAELAVGALRGKMSNGRDPAANSTVIYSFVLSGHHALCPACSFFLFLFIKWPKMLISFSVLLSLSADKICFSCANKPLLPNSLWMVLRFGSGDGELHVRGVYVQTIALTGTTLDSLSQDLEASLPAL